jgi:hypothetical protein
MGDFTGNLGHEGRRVWQGALNVGSSAFHEGRGAGKKTTPGGHDLVNRKKIVNEKEKLHGKKAGLMILDSFLALPSSSPACLRGIVARLDPD